MDNSKLLTMGDWHLHRERLKEPINRVSQLANDPQLYDTIDQACLNKQAFLFLSVDGFFVLRPRVRRQSQFIELTIAVCKGGNGILHYQPYIIELAKKGRAEFIEFLTARKGLDRVAPTFGWTKYGYHQSLAIWRYNLQEA